MTWSTALVASSARIFKNMHISVPKFCLYHPSSSVCRWWHFTIFMQILASCRMGNTSINQFWEDFYQCEWRDFDSTQSYKLKMKIRKSLSAGYHGKSATVYRRVVLLLFPLQLSEGKAETGLLWQYTKPVHHGWLFSLKLFPETLFTIRSEHFPLPTPLGEISQNRCNRTGSFSLCAQF